ncbi:MAG: flagellar basal body P-ring formation protein FlgA [Gammaproteobacteria bacterium]|nr:flagellar basal body P-ring formation protein FlgA [Gammaproteobacteria bacterium]
MAFFQWIPAVSVMNRDPQIVRTRASEKPPTRRFTVVCAAVFLTLCTAPGLLPATGADAHQSHRSIEAAAEQAAASRLPPASSTREIRAQRVDSRLQLEACAKPLRAELPDAFARGQRLTVSVRCDGPRPWKIYVPVDIHETVEVLVAARSLPRGAVLSSNDMITEERALAGLQRGYLSAPDAAAGMRLKRALRAGQIITPAHVAAARLIRRGQQVTLVAAGSGLKIAMQGVALADGALGQRIKVRNMSSKKEVEGVVRSKQNVEILLN